MSSEWKYGNWIAASWDRRERGRNTLLGIEEWLFRKRSDLQEVAIARVPDRGDGLFLDALVQFLEVDEFVYHEAFALPPLLYHPRPERVLIAGGGDGLALREALRDPRVEEVVLVEIDAVVIEACREYLPRLHRGSFDDPRSKIRVEDALAYLEDTSELFDVVLIDLLDGYDRPALELLRRAIELSRKVMNRGAILGAFGELSLPDLPLRSVHRELSRRFQHVAVHQAAIESFAGSYGFLLASDAVDFVHAPGEPFRERATALAGSSRSLVPERFPQCLCLPPFLRDALEEDAPPARETLAEAYSWIEKPGITPSAS
jgi:spermidine synthase